MQELPAGARLETVLLGALCGDVVRLWRGDGTAELRRVERPEQLSALIGRGELARSATPDPDRFREVALLDADHGALIALGRPHGEPSQGSAQVPAAAAIDARLVDEPAAPGWEQWAQWLGGVAAASARRSEFVVVEPGGWDRVSEPYVLIAVLPGDDGSPLSVVEAFPAPTGDPWTGPADERGGATMTAPASAQTVEVAGFVAVPALEMWAQSPFDAVLTFGRHPHGAWDPGTPAP